MMNYKTVMRQGEWEAIPGTEGKYVTQLYDILETPTNLVVATIPGYADQAKQMCRHLNMGGGFDGWTPQFFLAKIPPMVFSDSE